MQRRDFIISTIAYLTAGALFSGCEREPYKRKAERVFLGLPRELMLPVQAILEKGVVVFRDDDGWSALSGRCTLEGCDLSFTGKHLLCPCCRSYFSLSGRRLSGRAEKNLDWYKVKYHKEALYAMTVSIMPADYRFTTPYLETYVSDIRDRLAVEGPEVLAPIPRTITNYSAEEADKRMFRPYGELELGENYDIEDERKEKIRELEAAIEAVKGTGIKSLDEHLDALDKSIK